MDTPANEPPDFERIYKLYYPLLLLLAVRRFGVPLGEAEDLVHVVFVSYLGRWEFVHDTRRWLIGATCSACRCRHGEDDPLRARAG